MIKLLWYIWKIATKVLQVLLAELLIRQDVNNAVTGQVRDAAETIDIILNKERMQYVFIIVASLPIVVMYPFLQKFFVKGVMIGSVKG